MNNTAIENFRERVNADNALQARFVEAYAQGPGALAALGRANGFEFTEGEAAQAIQERLDDGELSEFELELVAGGGDPGSQDGNMNTTRTTKKQA